MAKRRGLIRKGPFHFANVPRILTAISEEEIEFQIESIFNICLFYLRTRMCTNKNSAPILSSVLSCRQFQIDREIRRKAEGSNGAYEICRCTRGIS